MSGKSLVKILFFLAICAAPISRIKALEAPLAPVIYTNSQGQYELYWFYPGLHQVHTGNDFAPPLKGDVGGKDDRNLSLLTPFGITPPAFIMSTSTYLLNYDYFPEWTGDQYSPIDMVLIAGYPPDLITELWRERIALDSSLTEPYQKIERTINLPITNSFQIWTSVQWLLGTPTAPVIGTSLGPPYLKQFILARWEGDFLFEPVIVNLMTGLTYLDWQGPETGGLDFRVRFSETAEALTENSSIIGETAGDSLRLILDGSYSGFAMIEVSDGQIRSFSDTFSIAAGKIAPLVFAPPLLNSDVPEGHFGECRLEITNVGSTAINYTCDADTSWQTVNPLPVKILAGESKIIEHGYKVPSDTVLTCLLFDFGDDYYPLRYNILLNPGAPTDIESEQEIIPAGFRVGQPYPNPFNSAVSFQADSDKKGGAVFQVFNLLGQKIYSTAFNPGEAAVFTWKGVDNRGREAGSGVYFFSFSQGNFKEVRRAVLLK